MIARLPVADLFTVPEILILGGLASLSCILFAMFFEGGYRRGPVGIAAICIGMGALTPALMGLSRDLGDAGIILVLISGCMALASVFLVPLLVIAGLCENSCSWKARVWHAAFLVAAWVFGIGMVFMGLIDGFH